MCIAVPVRIEELLPNKMAMVTLGGITMEISTILIENVSVGDYVIIHVGFALSKLDHSEAERTIDLMEMGEGFPAIVTK